MCAKRQAHEEWAAGRRRACARVCLHVCVSQIISGCSEERQAADEDWQARVETSGPVTMISVTGCTCERPEAPQKRRSIRRSAASHADGKAKSDCIHVKRHQSIMLEHVLRVGRMQSFHIVHNKQFLIPDSSEAGLRKC